MSATQQLAKCIPPPLRRRLGELRRHLRTLPGRTRRQHQRLLEGSPISEGERELLSRVSTRIFFNDGMYAGDGAHYFCVGLSAIRCIDEAVGLAGLKEVRSILDLPCGGGRVLRFLVQRFPEANLTACDLQHEMVDFCAAEFGASAVYSTPDFDKLALDCRYDLIWCGSLVTHLNAPGVNSLFRLFARHLSPGGVVVFTTHGARAAERMMNSDSAYDISGDSKTALIKDYREQGFGFASYPAEDDYGVPSNEGQYGISLTAPEWIRGVAESADLEQVYFAAHGWDDHQDVYGFTKQH